MMNMKKTIIIVLIIIALASLFFNGWQFYQRNHLSPTEPILVTLHDTLVIDSTRVVEHTKLQYITKDSIQYVYKTDSVVDSIYIPIDIEHKTYRDTITNESTTYDIHIDYSGYNSNIDRLEIKTQWQKEVTIPQKKPRKFHISLQAGYYTGYNLVDKRLYSGPGAGIGISYDLW